MSNLLDRRQSSSFQTNSIDQYISVQLTKKWEIPSYILRKLPNFVKYDLWVKATKNKQYENLNQEFDHSDTSNNIANSKNIPSNCKGFNFEKDKDILSFLILVWSLYPYSDYPEVITLYKTLSHYSKIILVRTLTGGDYRSLFRTGPEMLKFITIGDYLYPDSLQNMFNKYRVYNQYSAEIKWVLSKIYELPLTVIANLPDQKRDKLENIIIKYDGSNHLALAKEIGMYILPNQDNPVKYFLLNFASYRKVVNRPRQICQPHVTHQPKTGLLESTDLEIFRQVEFFVSYTSRKSLLENVIKIVDHPGFFVPFRRNPINLSTTLLTPIDNPIFMVGYGTPQKYRMYELEELNHAFRFMSFNNLEEEIETEEGVEIEEEIEEEVEVEILTTGRLRSGLLPISSVSVSGRLGSLGRIIPIFGLGQSPIINFTEHDQNSSSSNPVIFPIFSRPENPEDEFSKLEIGNLSSLLSCFFGLPHFKPKENNFIEEILSKIKMGQEIKAGLEMIDEEKMIRFRKLSVSEKKMVRKWLLILFEMGMYMRRWVGPGHPYPVLERDTLPVMIPSPANMLFSITENDPIHEQRSLSSILALKELEEQISPDLKNLLHSLIGCNLIKGRVYRDKMDLGTRLKIITTMGNKTTDACIRLSSTILVGSRYIYICKIFHQKIEGFDTNLIDQIA